MKFERALLVSAGLLFVAGGSVGIGYSAETNTASNVLSSLLTTTAGAIAQNQQAQTAKTVGTAIQGTPEVRPADNQQSDSQQAETVADNGESALPSFDDFVSDAPKANESPVKSKSAVTENVAAISDKLQTTATSQTEVTPQTSSQSVLPTTLTATQSENVAVSPAVAGKKIGFVDLNGNVLVAPSDMIFPAEMQDGAMYIFSKDIEALKKKLAEESQNPSQSSLQGNIEGQSSIAYQGANIPGQTTPGQTVPEQMIPGQAVPGQAMPVSNNGMWQYNPENGQNNEMPFNHPRHPGQRGSSQGDKPAAGNNQQGNYQRATPQQQSSQHGNNPYWNAQEGYPQRGGMPWMPSRAQDEKIVPSQDGQQMIPSAPNANSSIPENAYNAQTLDQRSDRTMLSRDASKKPIMFQCYLA